MNILKSDLTLNGKTEFYPGLNSKTYYIYKIDSNIKADQMCQIINEFITSSTDTNNKHYLGIDFEFNKVSKGDREIALMQMNLENDSNIGLIFILYPPELSNANNKILINLLTTKNIIKILHGSESLDIPYLFNQVLITKLNIDNFCENYYDTKFLCDYNQAETGTKGKCSIYHLLVSSQVITQDKMNNLEKIEEKSGPIYLIHINIHKMSNEIFQYSLYDVIYLPELIKKFLSRSPVYTQIIPQVSCLVNKYKRNIETNFQDLELLIQSMNMFFVLDNSHRVLLKDIWENYYFTLEDSNKYITNLKEINYFKKFFEILTKFFVYSNLGKYFKIYKNKNETVNLIDWTQWHQWLSQYTDLNRLFVEYNELIVNSFDKITSPLNKKIDK